MLGWTFTRRMVVCKMLAVNTTSKGPSSLALQTKDTEFTATLARLSLSLTLLTGDLLLVVSSSVAD
jgi:hypothetical protein